MFVPAACALSKASRIALVQYSSWPTSITSRRELSASIPWSVSKSVA